MIFSIETIKLFFESFIKQYTYIGLFISMTLESASLPIPSEVIMPFAGILAEQGLLNGYIAFIISLFGSLTGVLIDYIIGYFIGKDIFYKHLKFFHITRKKLDLFDEWFNENGEFAVFIVRLIPIIRGLISFPAGFSKMDLKKFILYSFAGIFIWNLLLMMFGFYLLSENISKLTNIFIILSIFALILYIIYKVFITKVMNKKYRKI